MNIMKKFLLRAVIVTSLMINFSVSSRLGIVGGEETDVEHFPFMAGYLTDGILKCGGSIISDKCVLTAAHCVAQYSINISLRIGSTFKDSGGRIISVAEVIKHKRFDTVKLTHDFAILKFSPIKFDKLVQPIVLTEATENLPDGTECKVSGWGKMETNESPTRMRFVPVYMVNQQTCQNNYNTSRVKFRIVDSMMCAGVPEGHADSCSGDSGGPLVCKGRLNGIVSSGFGCGLKDFPGIYGRVSNVRQWIKDICGV